ncbi:MAG: hypothetical protein M1549_00915 [Candidatus Dependentiae bacterium]|jgi:hypothetical protein|nr:hypothetical protein [Candidatus Dependentiae bacterium]
MEATQSSRALSHATILLALCCLLGTRAIRAGQAVSTAQFRKQAEELREALNILTNAKLLEPIYHIIPKSKQIITQAPELTFNLSVWIREVEQIRPSLEQAIGKIREKIRLIDTENRQNLAQEREAINAVRALKHGIAALQDTAELLTIISREHDGMLENSARLVKSIAAAASNDSLTKTSERLSEISKRIRENVLPMIRDKLPEIQKIFVQVFGT